MSGLIRLCVERPVGVSMVLLAVFLAGGIGLSILPVDILPSLEIPRVQVDAPYPGMTAREVRSLLTIPLEDAFASVRSLQRIRSVSRDGEAVLVLDFAWGTDPSAAAVLVREAIDAVYPQLPEGTARPLVISGDPDTEPVAIVGIRSKTQEVQFARHLAEYELRSRFRRIDEIGRVVLVGGQKEEVRLRIDPERSFARGLGASSLAQLIGSEWVDVSAGTGREGTQELVIVCAGKPESVQILSNLALPTRSGPLYTKDLGDVRVEKQDRKSIFIADGKESVALELYRRSGTNPIQAAKKVREVLAEAQKDFGKDAEVFLIFDGSAATRRGLADLGRSALLGALAVILAIFFFIPSGQGSLLTLLSLPFAAAAALAALALSGRSLNSMSLGGLALGIGLVSDTSVVILELLERSFGAPLKAQGQSSPDRPLVEGPPVEGSRTEGPRAEKLLSGKPRAEKPRVEKPRAAAVADTVASVASSSLGSTITTAIVFVPVLFLPGPLGSLFGDMAVCLVVMVAAGWVYAQFILPSLYRFLWKGGDVSVGHGSLGRGSGSQTKDPGMFSSKILGHRQNSLRRATLFSLHRLDLVYRRLLRFSFHRPYLFWIVAVLAVLAGTLLLGSRPVRFTPTDSPDELRLELAFPPGTALDVVAEQSEAVGKLLLGLPSFASVFGRAGSEEEDSLRRASMEYRKELVQFRCFLKQSNAVSTDELIKSIATKVRDYLDKEGFFSTTLRLEPPQDKIERILGLSSAYTVALKAENPDTLQDQRKIISDELESRLPDASLSWRPAQLRPEIRITLKPDMAASAQLSALSVGRSLMAYTDGLVAARIERDGRPIDIRVSGIKFGGESLAKLEMLPVNEGGKSPVLLGSIARIEQRESEAALARLDRSDVVYIDVLPRGGSAGGGGGGGSTGGGGGGNARSTGSAGNNRSGKTVSSSLERAVKDLKGLSYADESAFVRYQKTLLFTILLVILLLYLALAAQFESFTLPLLLMVSIPFSLAGAGPALFVVSAGLDSGSVLGLVVLFGLAVNNVIILYEVGRDKMGGGLPPVLAVYRGARERLRPVLATTTTTLLALLPVIVSPLGASQRSMAAAMFGGVAASTLISLLAFPPLLVPFLSRREASHAA